MRGRGWCLGAGLALACAAGGVDAQSRDAAACSGPVFTPAEVFAGPSEGRGTLRMRLGVARGFHVSSRGQVQPDGALRLEQTVRMLGEEPRTRHWLIRTVAPRQYAGTLSDASGPVAGHAACDRLELRYRVKGPLVMHQVLVLSDDGRTIDNTGRLTVMGVPVGWMKETIRRVGDDDGQVAAAGSR